jgi:hypothetical protein
MQGGIHPDQRNRPVFTLCDVMSLAMLRQQRQVMAHTVAPRFFLVTLAFSMG